MGREPTPEEIHAANLKHRRVCDHTWFSGATSMVDEEDFCVACGKLRRDA